MSDAKGASRSGNGGMNIDSKLVRELAELLAETGLTQIEVEDGDRKIKVARQVSVSAPLAAAPLAAPAPVAAPAAAPAPAPAADDANALKSPMVGTVYLSRPNPAPRRSSALARRSSRATRW